MSGDFLNRFGFNCVASLGRGNGVGRSLLFFSRSLVNACFYNGLVNALAIGHDRGDRLVPFILNGCGGIRSLGIIVDRNSLGCGGILDIELRGSRKEVLELKTRRLIAYRIRLAQSRGFRRLKRILVNHEAFVPHGSRSRLVCQDLKVRRDKGTIELSRLLNRLVGGNGLEGLGNTGIACRRRFDSSLLDSSLLGNIRLGYSIVLDIKLPGLGNLSFSAGLDLIQLRVVHIDRVKHSSRIGLDRELGRSLFSGLDIFGDPFTNRLVNLFVTVGFIVGRRVLGTLVIRRSSGRCHILNRNQAIVVRPCGLNSPINLLLFEHLGLVGAAILLEAGDHLAHALDKRSEHVDDLGPKRRHDLRHHGDVELARSIEIEVALVLICRLRTILRQRCIDRERRHDRRRLVELRGLTLVLERLADCIQATVGLGGLHLVLGRLLVDGQWMRRSKRVDKRPLTLVGKRARCRVLVLGVTSGLDIGGRVALSGLRINKRLNKRRLLNGSGDNLGNALSDLLDLGHNQLRRENLATRRVKRSINGNRRLNLSARLGHVGTHGGGRGSGRRLRHGHNRSRNRLNSLDNGSGALCHLSRHRVDLVLDLAIGGKHAERLHNIQTVANRTGIVAQRLLFGLLSDFCLVAHGRDDIKAGKGVVCGNGLYLLGGSGAEHRISSGNILLRVHRIIERIRFRRGDLGRVIVCLAARDVIANPACSATSLLGTVLDRTEQRGNRIRRVRKH